MSFDRPRPTDTVTIPTDPVTRVLVEMADACADFHLATRLVTYRGRTELRIWDSRKQGAAVQLGADWISGVPHFTRQGRPIARCDNLPEAVKAVRSRLRSGPD